MGQQKRLRHGIINDSIPNKNAIIIWWYTIEKITSNGHLNT